MKKIILASLLGIFSVGAAVASDGGIYTIETRETKRERLHIEVSAPVNSVRYTKPRCTHHCARPAAPVKVKTGTEIINHYAVYQPVTVYKHVGNYAQRSFVCNNTNPCM